MPHMPMSCARQGGERTARYGTCAHRTGARRAGEVPKLARGSVRMRPRQRRSTRVPAAQRHNSILWFADFFLPDAYRCGNPECIKLLDPADDQQELHSQGTGEFA